MHIPPDSVPTSTNAARPARITTNRILEIATKMENDLRLAGAEGRGLHALIGSIPLPACIRRAARTFSSIRNKMAHQANFDLKSEIPDDFWDLIQEVDEWLALAKITHNLSIKDLQPLKVTKAKPAKKTAKKSVKPIAKKSAKLR